MQILLRAFDALDTPLGRSQEPVVAPPGHDWDWCRERLVAFHCMGDYIEPSQIDTITAWVGAAHQQIEAYFLEEEGDDAEGRYTAHWRAIEWLTTLLSRAWWDTTDSKSLLVLPLALGELTHGRAFPFPLDQLRWSLPATRLRSWLHAAYDAHQLLAQQGGMLCSQPGEPNYQPPEEERLDWD